MADPFLVSGNASELTKEMMRMEQETRTLRQENRSLRLENTNLHARLALVTPAASIDGDRPPQLSSSSSAHAGVAQEAHSAHASVHSRSADTAATMAGATSNTTSTDVAAAQRSTSSRRTQQRSSSDAAGSATTTSSPPVSAARIEEAVQRVKKELQGDLEKHRKAVEVERAAKEQLKREFELFVSTTCEREAAYELVYAQIFRELESQKVLVRSAQAQLEEQRVEAVRMRTTLEAAVATAAASAAAATATSPAPVDPQRREVGAKAHADATHQAAKRSRKEKKTAATHPASSELLDEQSGTQSLVDAVAARPTSTPQGPANEGAETPASEAGSSVADSTGPRMLRIARGGAALRDTQKARRTMKGRGSTTSLATTPSSLVPPRQQRTTGLRVPLAPVFAPSAATTTGRLLASTSAALDRGGAAASVPSSQQPVHAAQIARSSTAATAPCQTAAPVHPLSPAAVDLFHLMTNHAEATQGFLPLWQQLTKLRGDERHTVLHVLVSVLLRLLGSEHSALAEPAVSSGPSEDGSCPSLLLPHSFTSQPTSITVVATAIRLLAVQAEEVAAQQRSGDVHHQQRSATLFCSLFYRVCVAALCRWQQTAEPTTAAEALEQWATAVRHLYGFQPGLLRLMQYTNATAAYHRTRLPHGWISFAARAVFARCFTACASSSQPAEAAMQQWRELCNGVGWSTCELPLEQIETAAARCVATTRAGHGPFTASCAEEALLALRLVVLYKGFDHMEHIAQLLEQPGVLPMMVTKEIYAELVSLAVHDKVPFRTQDALHHALRLLKEYLLEVAPERCTSAEHFVSVPRRSHILAAWALLQVVPADSLPSSAAVASSSSSATVATPARQVMHAASEQVKDLRQTAMMWLQEQHAALEMVRHSASLPSDRPLMLRDTPFGRSLLQEACQ